MRDLLAMLTRLRRHTHLRVFISYAITQGVVFATSLARIPLIVAAVGSNGYGVAVAISSIQGWVVIIILSVTHLTQVSVSEDLGRKDPLGVSQTIAELRRKARMLMLGLAVAGVVLAFALPWAQLLHAQRISSELTIKLAICASMFLLASCAPGSVYLGVLNAQKKVALTQSFPALGAVASLAVTAVGWAMHLGIDAFVVAPAVAACIPFWVGPILGRKALRSLTASHNVDTTQPPPTRSSGARGLRPRDFLILTGVAAPPLFSTGLDPIVLSVSRGPGAVAAYGLATRLGLLIVMLPAALYPLYWTTFSRLRAEGDIRGVFALYRKELLLLVTGTSALGILYIGAAPFVAHLLSDGKVGRPMLLYLSLAVLGLLSAVQSVTLPLLAGTRTAPKTALLVFGLIIPNEALSYALSRAVGAAGPILASIVATLVLLGICGLMIRRDPRCVVDESVGMLDSVYGESLTLWRPIQVDEGTPARRDQDAGEAGGFSRNGHRPVMDGEPLGLRPLLPSRAATTELAVLSDVAPKSRMGDAATQAQRRWRKASWFAVATYVAWSPLTTINKFLPSGSTTRGVVLTLIPLIGVVSVMNLPRVRARRSVDLVVVLLGALIVWQGISVETTAGFQYFLHVGPATALLLLAVVSRGEYSGLSLEDIRVAIKGVLPALCFLLLAGWIAQYAHLVPVSGPTGSTFGLAIHGFRLQGLTSGPNLLGFLAAITTFIAFVAQPGKLAWFTRVLGLVSLLGSDSRTSIIVLAIGLLALWVLGPGRSTAQRLFSLAAVALGGLAARSIIFTQRSDNTDVLSNRDNIWRDLIPYLHHLPLFGNGPNFLPKLVPLVFGPYAVTGQILDPQNQWLNDAIQFGFVAAILLTLFLFAVPLHASKTYRMVLLVPLVLMVIVECFSEVPLAVFGSIDGAFPLFFLVMWAPLRRATAPPEDQLLFGRANEMRRGRPNGSALQADGRDGQSTPALI
jgi:O-antigen/teichoic acid export membrane protein